jgi:dTMP kinase
MIATMQKPSCGRLIVLEGGEGAGKSTQTAFVVEWLRAQGREVVRTREPGGSPLAEAIRGVVLGDWAEGVSPLTELLLIFAARAAHLHATVMPALHAGQDVVCDRFVDASYAYQGGGRQLGEASVHTLEALVLGELQPDLVLLLDIDPVLGLERTRRRGEENRFEAETLAFMQRVRAAYLRRAAAAPDRYVIIDAAQSPEAVQAAVAAALTRQLMHPSSE